jgi:hypothetical protein
VRKTLKNGSFNHCPTGRKEGCKRRICRDPRENGRGAYYVSRYRLPPTIIMTVTLPPELYLPIIDHFDGKTKDGRIVLLSLSLVSRSMKFEAQRLLLQHLSLHFANKRSEDARILDLLQTLNRSPTKPKLVKTMDITFSLAHEQRIPVNSIQIINLIQRTLLRCVNLVELGMFHLSASNIGLQAYDVFPANASWKARPCPLQLKRFTFYQQYQDGILPAAECLKIADFLNTQKRLEHLSVGEWKSYMSLTRKLHTLPLKHCLRELVASFDGIATFLPIAEGRVTHLQWLSKHAWPSYSSDLTMLAPHFRCVSHLALPFTAQFDALTEYFPALSYLEVTVPSHRVFRVGFLMFMVLRLKAVHRPVISQQSGSSARWRRLSWARTSLPV